MMTAAVPMDVENFFQASLPVEDPLRTSLIKMMKAKYDNTPRHLQVALGPSEVGHPCMRKMAFGIMVAPRCNPSWDPLPSIIGTAAHKWMEEAAQLANEQLGRTRWLFENRVEVTPGLTGSCDLYDVDTGTVIDHKFPGVNRFKIYSKQMSETFRGQAHMYGRGFKRLGYDVKTVAVALFPRAGKLSGMHVWKEDYDGDLVDEILTRREQVIGLCDDFDVTKHPERYAWFPATPSDCAFCPWFNPHAERDNLPFSCPGDSSTRPRK